MYAADQASPCHNNLLHCPEAVARRSALVGPTANPIITDDVAGTVMIAMMIMIEKMAVLIYV